MPRMMPIRKIFIINYQSPPGGKSKSADNTNHTPTETKTIPTYSIIRFSIGDVSRSDVLAFAPGLCVRPKPARGVCQPCQRAALAGQSIPFRLSYSCLNCKHRIRRVNDFHLSSPHSLAGGSSCHIANRRSRDLCTVNRSNCSNSRSAWANQAGRLTWLR